MLKRLTSSRVRRGFGRELVVVAMIVLAGPPSWSSWTGSSRPLSRDESCDREVSRADVIGIGRLLDLRSEQPCGAPRRSVATVQFDRVLKGEVRSSRVEISVGMWDSDAFQRSQKLQRANAAAAIFMAKKHRGRLWAVGGPPLSPIAAFTLLGDNGVPAQQQIALIDSALTRTSEEELAGRADLIVVGRTTDAWRIEEAAGRRVRSFPMRVDSVLSGSPERDTLRLCLIYAELPLEGPALLFLARIAPARYEVIGFENGCLPVRAGRVVRTGESLASVCARVRETRANAAQGESRESHATPFRRH